MAKVSESLSNWVPTFAMPRVIACSQDNSLPPFQYFKGAIDEIRVYNRALSALEIEALYQGR